MWNVKHKDLELYSNSKLWPYFELSINYFPQEASIYLNLIMATFYQQNTVLNKQYIDLLQNAVNEHGIILSDANKTNLKRFTL